MRRPSVEIVSAPYLILVCWCGCGVVCYIILLPRIIWCGAHVHHLVKCCICQTSKGISSVLLEDIFRVCIGMDFHAFWCLSASEQLTDASTMFAGLPGRERDATSHTGSLTDIASGGLLKASWQCLKGRGEGGRREGDVISVTVVTVPTKVSGDHGWWRWNLFAGEAALTRKNHGLASTLASARYFTILFESETSHHGHTNRATFQDAAGGGHGSCLDPGMDVPPSWRCQMPVHISQLVQWDAVKMAAGGKHRKQMWQCKSQADIARAGPLVACGSALAADRLRTCTG